MGNTGQITLIFRQFRIGRIDLDKRVYTLKKCYLLDNDPRLRRDLSRVFSRVKEIASREQTVNEKEN